MFQVMILVCSVNLAPADCQIETATDLINGPPVAREIMCGLHGQAYIAQSSLRPRPAGEYVKVKCPRSAKGEIARRDR